MSDGISPHPGDSPPLQPGGPGPAGPSGQQTKGPRRTIVLKVRLSPDEFHLVDRHKTRGHSVAQYVRECATRRQELGDGGRPRRYRPRLRGTQEQAIAAHALMQIAVVLADLRVQLQEPSAVLDELTRREAQIAAALETLCASVGHVFAKGGSNKRPPR